jgi:predicted transcriptional regulator
VLPDVRDIEKRRKALGLTQKKLSMLAGVSQSFVAKIESEKVSPGYEIVKKIFGVFDELSKEGRVAANQIMSKHVVAARKSDKVGLSIETMRKFGYSQLPVLDRNQVIGTISEKTILDIVSNGKSLSSILNKKVESVMTEALPRISENESVDVISALLQSNPAVLVTKKGKVTGIIAKADLFKLKN